MRRLLILLLAIPWMVALPTKNDVHIHKKMFTHTGPEGPLEKKITVGKALKNFKVLFVNIPSPYAQLKQSEAKALQVSLAPEENMLALYVLSPKKTKQELEIVNLRETIATQSLPPEVHFLKYNDEQDVEETQRRIADHYLASD